MPLMEEESSGQACFCIIVQRPGNFLLDIVIFVFRLQWEKRGGECVCLLAVNKTFFIWIHKK